MDNNLKSILMILQEKPKVICLKETWLKPHLDFKIQGYEGVRKDRKIGTGGGVVTFIEQNLRYRVISSNEIEAVIVEIWTDKGSIKVINLYNVCKKIQKEKCEELVEYVVRKNSVVTLIAIALYGKVRIQILMVI